MRHLALPLLAVPLLLGASITASAAPGSGAVLYSVTGLDIANVRLGMSPDEVRATMQRSGYALSETTNGVDFAGEVQRRAMERRSEDHGIDTRLSYGIGAQIYSGAGTQRVTVDYGPTPSGQRAIKVTYLVQLDYMDQSTFSRTVLQKYGSASHRTNHAGQPQSYSYCDVSDSIFDWGCRSKGPSLMAVVVYPWSMRHWRAIFLDEGKVAFAKRQAAIEAAVDRMVPKVQKPQF